MSFVFETRLLRFFFELRNSLFRYRKMLWHSAAEFLDSLPYFLTNLKVGLIRALFALNIVSTKFFLCLRGSKKIRCKLSTSHMIQDFLTLL